MDNLPPHDAFFRITSEQLQFFGGSETIKVQRTAEYFDIKIDPVHISATLNSQLSTVMQLQMPKNKRWHDLLLNQVHDAIPEIDLTESAQVSRPEADQWLLNFMVWNQEQLQVIKGIKTAKGGVVIVMGPAGCGKSLLQKALAVYFWLLGFHILNLAPANSNVDHAVLQLAKIKANDLPGGAALKFMRIYPSIRDYAPPGSDGGDDEARSNHDKMLPFYDLLTALDEEDAVKGTAKEHGLVQAVIHAARHNTHKLTRRLRNDAGKVMGGQVNAW